MKKILILVLLMAFQFGYLQWGGNKEAFIYNATAEVFSKLFSHPKNFFHPAILLPFAGEVILLFTLFQKKPNRKLIIAGLSLMSLLMLLLFLTGILTGNFKIILSTLPFFAIAILIIVITISQKKKGP